MYENMTDEELQERVYAAHQEQASLVTNCGRDEMIQYLEERDTPPTLSPRELGDGSMTLFQLQREAHFTSRSKGWWDDEMVEGDLSAIRVMRVIPEKLMLMVTELAEAMEDYRQPDGLPMLYWDVRGTKIVWEELLRSPEPTVATIAHDVWATVPSEKRGEVPPIKRKELVIFLCTHFKPQGFGIELADCVIRILDLSDALSMSGMPLPIQLMTELKMVYNRTRPRRHGGKRA